MISQALHDAWWRLATQRQPRTISGALASSVLSAFSGIYGAAVALRNRAYDAGWAPQVRLPCRVVSVGNLTVGGTGKTACVELVANKLLGRGQQVAILSRGYGGSRKAYWLRCEEGTLACDGRPLSDDEGVADEPQLLARHLAGVPVMVGAKRARTGMLACTQFAADTVVLDDGFQHRHLRRDCEIVLVHARMPFNGWPLLPRGPMREPLNALKRADIVIMTKADEALSTLGALTERLRSFNRQAVFATATHEPVSLLDAVTGTQEELKRLNGLRVGLLSSIGDPEGFEATMRRLHATIVWHRTFPDHYRYRAMDWTKIMQEAQVPRPEALVTTEKDWVRLRPWVTDQGSTRVPVWVLGVRMKLLSGDADVDDRLARLYAC